VPRPETELVAGAAVDEAARVVAGGRVPVVVDLCTGSGAIAASIATEVTGSRVYAVELDPAAHAWAARNLSGTGVELRHGDMAEAFPELDGTVDVVVTNPPYIPVDGIVRDPEVAEHDPALALWSGTDGLDAMRVVATVGARLLRPGGLLVAEHADLQGESAPAVFDAARGWAGVQDHEDLAGRPRFVTARRAG
jgi:release factor glutamine methyltransferase